MTKTRVVVYGLSTEGYSVACRMSLAGAEVSIIDETTPSALLLKPEIAKTYPNISLLTQDEPLLATTSVDDAISAAHYLFFAPQIRKIEFDIKTEMHSKFKDATSLLPKGASFVNCVPTGIGGNNENISLLEHVTGHIIGKAISYFYCPLGEFGMLPETIGSYNSKVDTRLNELFAHGFNSPNQVTLSTSENFHAINVISKFTRMCSILEVCKYVKDNDTRKHMGTEEIRSIFLHDMISELYDLRSLSTSFDSIGTLSYLINSGIKGIDGYLKRLINEIRITLKKNELKAARTKIAISWTLDKHEMRGDRIEMMKHLMYKLRDYIGDVEILDESNTDLVYSDKTMIIIVCSSQDLKNVAKKGTETIVIMANPLCETA